MNRACRSTTRLVWPRILPSLSFVLSAYSLVLMMGTYDAMAQVPALIRYQGQAVDANGVPLEGPYTLTLRLYPVETGGTALWTEVQANVPLSKGHFSVLLGQVTALTVIDWSQPLWLGLQVNQEPELSPRQQITSVPLALRAEKAEQLTQPITPALITPQGAGSGLDADTVDGKHATQLLDRANHTGTQPSSTITGTFVPSVISPQGSGSGLDADTVDGLHASQLVTPRGTPLHLCPDRYVYGSRNGTTCNGQVTPASSCSYSVCSAVDRYGNPANCGSAQTSCSPAGYLMP